MHAYPSTAITSIGRPTEKNDIVRRPAITWASAVADTANCETAVPEWTSIRRRQSSPSVSQHNYRPSSVRTGTMNVDGGGAILHDVPHVAQAGGVRSL